MSSRHDDAIIGVAFRRSLQVFALIALLVLAWFGWQWLNRPAEVVVEEAVALDLDDLLSEPEGPSAPMADFVDRAQAGGVDFQHVSGAYGERLLPETMGGGVAVLDHDGDGDQDLLFINGQPWSFDPDQPDTPPPTLRLYDNDGLGAFTEVTDALGLGDLYFYGMGVAIGDVNGDARVDVFVSAVGSNRLLMNTPEGFVDVTTQAGVAGADEDWSTSAGFFDADGDGDLDLMVTQYVQWSREIDLAVDYRLTGIGRAYGPPTNFGGTQNHLYMNDGDGRFEEVTERAGLMVNNPATGEAVGKGLALIPTDLDRDGLLDVVVANDTVRNFVFHNQGDGQFLEVGTEWGLGFDRNGMATGAMGIDAAFMLDDDQRLGIAIGNFANEMSSLYVSQALVSQFADQSIAEGIGAPTRAALTFGVGFVDYDNDGRLDYVQANGHVENEINRVQASQQYRQPAQLFWNCGPDCSQTFQVLGGDQIGDLAKPIVGRGLAWGDLNADGRTDLVATQIDCPPLVLFNNTETGHHWLTVSLRGVTPNTSAIGAELLLTAGDLTQRRSLMPTRSYLSQVALPIHFGLGDIDRVDELTIRWPNGQVQTLTNLPVNQQLVVDQPAS
ncbi:MAG: CRTAC1 family protein [Pseudomonadota bacterium]